MFPENFFLVKKTITFLNYANGGGGEVVARYGVASLRDSFFIFIISDKIDQNGLKPNLKTLTFHCHFPKTD